MSYYFNITRSLLDDILYEFDDLVEASDSGTIMHRDDAFYAIDYDEYYEDNYDLYYATDTDEYYADRDNVNYCECCGEYYYHEDNWNFRQNCCVNCESDALIASYHDVDRYDLPTFGDASDGKTIGLEIEVDNGRDRNDCARELRDTFGDRLYFEDDSSLSSDGFEIKTAPHTFTEIMSVLSWETFRDTLKRYNFKSHDTNTCGLHMHFHKSWFGDTLEEQNERIALVCKWYSKNYDVMKLLSRRTDNYYCQRDTVDVIESNLEKTIEKKKYGARNVAVNLNNLDGIGTIEFRLGRGTINPKTIRAWIDIHRAIIDSSANASNYCFSSRINKDTVNADTWTWLESRLAYVTARATYNVLVRDEETETA